jgi:porin
MRGGARSLCVGLALFAMMVPAPLRAQPSGYMFQQPTLTGDWFGVRNRLEDHGVLVGGAEIVEVLGSPNGRKSGTEFDGRFELFANVDLDTALGWRGAIFHANAYQIHGDGLSSKDLRNLLTVSNIEAQPATRLFGLWIQQSLLGDTVSLRIGQIAADDEFFVSQYASLLINSTFGWPSIMGVNLPGGGPAYPSARPGIRAKVAATSALVFSAAAFCSYTKNDRDGLGFQIGDDVLLIGEAAYSADIADLPGSLKLGAWHHSARFADQRVDRAGLPLASPASTLIDFHFDGGLTYSGLLPGRQSDLAGVGLSYERISRERRGYSEDVRAVTGVSLPLPDFELAVELSYQAQLAPWWIVQPDLQIIVHPGARLTAAKEDDAVVLGLRTGISF